MDGRPKQRIASCRDSRQERRGGQGSASNVHRQKIMAMDATPANANVRTRWVDCGRPVFVPVAAKSVYYP